MKRKQLRLVKVIVQPMIVADDGETLELLDVSPIHVSAEDWPTFSNIKWPKLLEEQSKAE